MGKTTEAVFGGTIMILFLLFGIFQIAAGWAGIEDSFGWGWGYCCLYSCSDISVYDPNSFRSLPVRD